MPDATEQPSDRRLKQDGTFESRSIAEMSPDELRAMLTRRTVESSDAPGDFVELGGGGSVAKRLLRTFGWSILILLVAGTFVIAFYQFTNSLRVALVVVAGMMTYMYAASRLAEGRLDERE